MSTRRPTMLRFNKWLENCIEFIDKSPRAAASDKRLVVWARLLRLCEEITNSFGYDSDVVSLSESRVQLMLKSFEMRLSLWDRELAPELKTGILALSRTSKHALTSCSCQPNDFSQSDALPPRTCDP